MSAVADISIRFTNKTGKSDFEVVVFTKNFIALQPYYSAWQLILRGQTTAEFVYPVLSTGVGATYEEGGQEIVVGPFDAKLGSTWKISQESEKSIAVLEKVEGVNPNPDNAITIRNVVPTGWTGRAFNVGVYKDGRLLVTQPHLELGTQVHFMIKPTIFFGVVQNDDIKVGDTFTFHEIKSSLVMYDLCQYQNGIEVSLEQEQGKYTFVAKSFLSN